jgi:hypothetical protein
MYEDGGKRIFLFNLLLQYKKSGKERVTVQLKIFFCFFIRVSLLIRYKKKRNSDGEGVGEILFDFFRILFIFIFQ